MPLDAGAFTKKLQSLQPTTESIQTITNWCLFHKSYATGIVKTWQDLCMSASTTPTHRLTLLYLANDIIQTTRRSTPVFVQAFQQVLQPTFLAFMRHTDTKSGEKVKVERMVDVWQGREVFGDTYIQQLRSAIGLKPKSKEEALQATNQKQKPTRTNGRSAEPTQPQRSHSHQRQASPAPTPQPAATLSVTDALIQSDELCSLLLTLEQATEDDDLIAQLAEPYLTNTPAINITTPTEITRILKQYEANIQQQVRRRQQLKELLTKRLKLQDAVISEAQEQLQQCQSQIAHVESGGSPSAAKRQKTDTASSDATDSADHYNELLRSLSTIQSHVNQSGDEHNNQSSADDDLYVP